MNEELKRFLLFAPSRYNYEVDANVRKELRKRLILSVSKSGEYLDWLFPEVSNLERTLEKDFDWEFANYLKTLSIKRDVQNTHDHSAFHPNQPCSKIFRRGEPIYRCLTCGIDETCAMCSHCYQPEEHKDHDTYIAICLRENGGVCDCGDPEAWKRQVKCPYALTDSFVKDREIPSEFSEAIHDTLSVVLDYIIDAMSRSDTHLAQAPHDEKNAVIRQTQLSAFEPHGYASCPAEFQDQTNGNFSLVLYNDQIHHYREAIQRVRLASGKFKDFATMITEKVQNYGRAKVITSKNLDLLIERQNILNSTGMTSCIRSDRDIFREDICDEMINWLNDYTESEFFKASKVAKDIFCQTFCEPWICGVTKENESKNENENESKNESKNENEKEKESVFSMEDGLALLQKGKLNKDLSIPNARSLHHHHHHQQRRMQEDVNSFNLDKICPTCEVHIKGNTDKYGSRLQYIIYFDVRFWKSARIILRDMFSTSLITNLEFKNTLSSQYVDIYTGVANNCMIVDREPEQNLMTTLSTQLFMSQSNSKSIIQRGDFISILQSIHAFLTSRLSSPNSKLEFERELSMKDLKSRRWGQLFFDISFVINKGKEHRDVLSKESIAIICDILELFQGRPPLKRETENHIEYENSDYTTIFQSVQTIYKFAELSADSMNSAENTVYKKHERARSAIYEVLKYLRDLDFGKISGVKYENTDINLTFDLVLKEPITGMMMKLSKVECNKVSFLHPLHSFLSWLIEYANFPTMDTLRDILQKVQNENVVGSYISIESIIFDYPIKAIVLLSQIKAGFWVRNGFSVKSQLHLYRNSGIRDYGYMRDLYLIQILLNIAHPEFVTFFLLDRWSLNGDWLMTSVYEENILPYMLEECLGFFIHLSTESIFLRGISEDDLRRTQIEQEIIHNLCFEPLGYKKLCSYIPENIVNDKKFDIILNEITIYKKPTGSNDAGVLQLKDKYLDEVNPYYSNYTLNRREEALKFVKARKLEKIASSKEKKVPIVIEPVSIKCQILDNYSHVVNFSTTSYFQSFLLKILLYVQRNDCEKVESLFETALHLIMICSLEDLIDKQHGDFYTRFIEWTKVEEKLSVSICQLLYSFLSNSAYGAFHDKIRAIFDLIGSKHSQLLTFMEELIPNFDLQNLHNDLEKSSSVKDEAAKKKRLAKKKQNRLMEKFKKQQAQFLENNVKGESLDDNFEDVDMGQGNDENNEKKSWSVQEQHCILCQDTNTENEALYGMVANIAQAATFRNVPFEDDYWFLRAFSSAANLNLREDQLSQDSKTTSHWHSYMSKIKNENTFGPGFDIASAVDSKLVSLSCGHVMHFQCYLNYVASSHARLTQITRNTPENSQEILCPLCKSVNNVFIPIFGKCNSQSLKQYLSKEPTSISTTASMTTTTTTTTTTTNTTSSIPLLTSQSCGNPFTNMNMELFMKPEYRDLFFSLYKQDLRFLLGPEEDSVWFAWEGFEGDKFHTMMEAVHSAFKTITFPLIVEPTSPEILSNTIKSTEIALRGINSPHLLIIHQMTNSATSLLQNINNLRLSLIDMALSGRKPVIGKDPRIMMMTTILSFTPENINSTLTQGDFFEILVSIIPAPSLGLSFNSILRFIFVCHVIQTLHILWRELESNSRRSRKYSFDDIPRYKFLTKQDHDSAGASFRRFQSFGGGGGGGGVAHFNISDSVIYTMLLKAITPFLRRSLLLAFVQCANDAELDIFDNGFDNDCEKNEDQNNSVAKPILFARL
ncbi:hypothetical protein LELG_04225 [Lodderomyces elongisporus NRRL YB-4239]|uniref:E3 ubiquitin-protein ligase n=1 Tax=Lodderomyces elongisporus (strain ATCC 11503 / CBS 2605 / JCM 1781 / NBRC 1676 / NRRL YB-4239) TaxID=379508 RepID=A5E3N7_LODEL|nr:hypothetical protein LELG_04225 [Lodderomyces elongisporus NRRL YB-4239]